MTADNVAQLVAEAKTPEEHEALATYFRGEAAANAAKVKQHEAMIASYKKTGGRPYQLWKQHCDTLIHSYRQAQQENEKLAAEHEKLAKEAKAN